MGSRIGVDRNESKGTTVLRESFEAHQEVVALATPILVPVLHDVVELTVARLLAGNRVMAFGNGGSAAQAQHFAAEIVGRYAREREPWPALALSADPVLLTAVANDYGVEQMFARQVAALGRPGDIVVAISTSGISRNVVEGALEARRRDCHVVAMTGAGGGTLAGVADHVLEVPSASVARVQEVHAICLHAWAESVESELVSRRGRSGG